MPDAASTFREALRSRGISPPAELVADGRIHRCDAEGKIGKNDAAYLLHLDGIPAGGFENHRDGLGWMNWRAPLRRTLTPSEHATHRARMGAIKRQREIDEGRRREAAAARAAEIWREAVPATADHPYLDRKSIAPCGIRQHADRLVVPVRVSDKLVSLQLIDADGTKRFLTDGLTRGAYFAIGKPGDVICIAEGFATAATIHAATGHAVAVAFYCANLAPVSGALRAKFPAARLVVCADDDRGTEGNPGVSSAIAAAKAIGGFVALPDFGPDRPDGATDFNDLARLRGADAVRQSIEAADMGVPAATSIAEPEVVLVSAEAVKPEPIQWLWRDWLAAGKLHVVAGAPGTGKTTIALALGASITSGGLWPDGSKAPIGSVLMWSSEDGFADTIIPRLMAAGADRSRFHFIDGVKDADGTRPFDPAHDVPVLRRALARVTTPRLLIVDPIVSAVAGDGHKSNDVRRGLQPLVNLAAEYGCAVIGVTHHSKNTKGADPLERVTGSIAYGALARLVFAAAKMADGADGPGRIFARAKSNIGPDGGGYRYSLVETEVVTDQPIRTSRVEWGEAVDGTARDLLAEAETAGEDTADERKDAVRWLHDLLASGPLAADEVQRLAEHDGLKWRTVQRAKVKAGAVSERDGFGPGAKYVWRLAMPATESPCVPCAPSFEAGTHGKHGQSAPESTPGREVF